MFGQGESAGAGSEYDPACTNPTSPVGVFPDPVRARGLKPGGWAGQLWDCSCVDTWVHHSDRDSGRHSGCPANRRRCSDVELGELRQWLAEVERNTLLATECTPDAMSSIEGHLRALGADLSKLDVSALDGDALMGTVLALEGLRRRLDAVSAVTLGRLDNSGVTDSAAGLRTKRWKANRTHASGSTVARELRVAGTLLRFDGFAESLAAGHISTDHVIALANAANSRVIDALVELEASLVLFAQRHRFEVFVRHLSHLVALLDSDGAEPDCGDTDSARMALDSQDHLHLIVELTGHNATVAKHIIDHETDRQYRAAVREQEASGIPVPEMPVLRARAIAELLRRGADANPNSSKPTVEAILPVTVDRDGRPTALHAIGGGQLDSVTAAVLICDAHLQPVVVDPTGNPLNPGRTERFFTSEQRRALIVRDGGCVFPGCDQPASRCDAHHEVPWEFGGETDVDHGALLCRRHHGLLHGHNPWIMRTVDLAELADDLAAAHRVRAHSARLEPTGEVRVWETPGGGLLLAQIAADHFGPAPPDRMAAA